MNERDALMRAICENPDDDTPRLVFADWLQEQGDEVRAEFIRTQVRFGEVLRHGVADTQGFGSRARELWLQHGAQWLAELPVVSGLSWHDALFRGFSERAAIASDTELVRHAESIFSQPIRHLGVRRFRGVAGFAELRGLRHLKSLSLATRQPTEKALNEILKCASLPDSLMLSCSFGAGGNEYAARLRAAFGSRLVWPRVRTAPR